MSSICESYVCANCHKMWSIWEFMYSKEKKKMMINVRNSDSEIGANNTFTFLWMLYRRTQWTYHLIRFAHLSIYEHKVWPHRNTLEQLFISQVYEFTLSIDEWNHKWMIFSFQQVTNWYMVQVSMEINWLIWPVY